jgi:RNA polymerase sigma factor (sigma-70 family)
MAPFDDRHCDQLKRAIAGDEAALSRLLAEIEPQLTAYITRKLPADVARTVGVDDIISMTHAEVFRRISFLEPHGQDAFYRWVATIALNRIRNTVKKLRAVKRGGAAPAAKRMTADLEDSTVALWEKIAATRSTPSRAVARGEAIGAIHLALEGLPEQYRQAIWLVHIERRPVKAAAAAMQRSERSIHGLCRRGLQLLKEELETFTRFL